mgnify:CR=1 FL=1
MTEPLLTPEQVADRLQIPVARVRQMCRSHELPAIKLGESRRSIWRIDPDEIKRIEEKGKAA